MKTLREISQKRGRNLDFTLGSYRNGPASTIVSLLIEFNDGAPRASLVAAHYDPEGMFAETLNADFVLEKAGERAVDAALETLRFDSETPTSIHTPEDFAWLAPEVLDN